MYKNWREHRLRLTRDFDLLLKKGKRKSRGPLRFIAYRQAGRTTALGLIVSRKVGNAVKRNTCKRRLREIFRSLLPQLPEHTLLAVQVFPSDDHSFQTLQQAFEEVLPWLDRLPINPANEPPVSSKEQPEKKQPNND